jgi:hypothetical protein
MRSAIDSAGRLVIRDGRIEIEAAPTPMKLVKRRGGPVAVPQEALPPLTDDIVRATLERTRR